MNLVCTICYKNYRSVRSARRFCSQHCYRKWKEHRPPIERFWKFVEKSKTHWLWIGGQRNNGYGAFKGRLTTSSQTKRGHMFTRKLLILFLVLTSESIAAADNEYFIQCTIKVKNISTGRSYIRKSKTFAAPASDRKESWERCIDDLINENNFSKEELSVEKGEVREPVTTKHKQNQFKEAAEEAAKKTDEKYGIKLK